MDISVKTTEYAVENRSWLASAHGTEATRTITLDISAFNAAIHYPNGYIPSGMVLARITSTGLYGPYAGRVNAKQTVTVTGAPTGGTFTLTFDGETTAPIDFNATASAVRDALVALPGIDAGDVVVTGGPLPGAPVVVEFAGKFSGTAVVEMTADDSELTGGESPAVDVATTQAGGSEAVDGLDTAVGHLFSSKQVSGSGADLGAALLEHGAVLVSALPANAGLDEAAKSDLAGRVIYR